MPLKDLSDHCEEHVLLVIIDGDMRGIANTLILEGDEEIIRNGLGNLKQVALLNVISLDKKTITVRELWSDLPIFIGAPMYFIIVSHGDRAPGQAPGESHLSPCQELVS